MGFRENLLQKVQINRLAGQVRQSLRSSDAPRRIDRSAMQRLLEMSAYDHLHERDLDLYWRAQDSDGKKFIIVLDNELKLYHTTIEDVVLRKSPTVKEMVSIRNAIKILNDRDVVLSSKTDTLQRVQSELIDALDLSYTPEDIRTLAQDGREALKNGYAEGVIETLVLFAEILGYVKAPKALQAPHHQVWGALIKDEGTDIQMGPIILFSMMHLTLKLLNGPISTLDKSALSRFQQVLKDDIKADSEGSEVFAALEDEVLSRKTG